MSGEMEDLMSRIARAANEQLRRESAWVEGRIRSGENRVEYVSASGHHLVVEVPRWRDRPFRRLRIEWLRRRS